MAILQNIVIIMNNVMKVAKCYTKYCIWCHQFSLSCLILIIIAYVVWPTLNVNLTIFTIRCKSELDILDLQHYKYCHLISDVSSIFPSSMIVICYINVRMHSIPKSEWTESELEVRVFVNLSVRSVIKRVSNTKISYDTRCNIKCSIVWFSVVS